MRRTGAGDVHRSGHLSPKEFAMKRNTKAWLYLLLCLVMACNYQRAKSENGFDKIRETVKGKSPDEVERILGRPDTKQVMLSSGERWIWWNYTFLEGKDYPPELRGKVVHLEIIFQPDDSPGIARAASPGELRVSEPFGVSYTLPPETK
jgi:hypothetical protein